MVIFGFYLTSFPMKIKIFVVISLYFLSILNIGAKTLDHELFLREMQNSSNQVYLQCLSKYDEYLSEFPDDIEVLIEKCKFIQFAQYSEDEEYNPNQTEFDNCVAYLTENFPDSPEVLIFQTSFLWGEELQAIFTKAEESIENNPEKWSDENLAALYFKMATSHYWNEETEQAYKYITKAIEKNDEHESSLEHVQILIEMGNKEEALNLLLTKNDTTKVTWELSQKANLLLQLEAYSEALELYEQINEIDSTFNNNLEIANTLEATGAFDSARPYLLADTSQHWDKELAIRNLLIHDIKYQDGAKCVQTYNSYRDLGYFTDSIGIYRLKIFFLHPFQPLKIRDFVSLFGFLLCIALLLVLPSIWILPIYFIGHYFKFLDKNQSLKTQWGLKAFWFVSAGYLLASFFSVFINPELLYSFLNSSYLSPELTENQMGLAALIFILLFSVFGFAPLYKKNLSILGGNSWSVGKSLLVALGLILVYKAVTTLYVQIGVLHFDLSIGKIASTFPIFLSSEQEVQALISTYGGLAGFFIVALLVPIYEEIIFRGVIFDACQKYLNANSAIAIQALLFATVHLDLFLFPAFFLFGIMTGVLRKKSGGLLSGIVFHIINNALAVIVLILQQ